MPSENKNCRSSGGALPWAAHTYSVASEALRCGRNPRLATMSVPVGPLNCARMSGLEDLPRVGTSIPGCFDLFGAHGSRRAKSGPRGTRNITASAGGL